MVAVAVAHRNADLMDSTRHRQLRSDFRGLDYHERLVPVQSESARQVLPKSERLVLPKSERLVLPKSEREFLLLLATLAATLSYQKLDSTSDGATVGGWLRSIGLVLDEKLKLPSLFKCNLLKFIALFMGPSLIKDLVLAMYYLRVVLKLSRHIEDFLFRLWFNPSRRHEIFGFRTRMKDAIHRYHTGRCITSTLRPGQLRSDFRGLDYHERLVPVQSESARQVLSESERKDRLRNLMLQWMLITCSYEESSFWDTPRVRLPALRFLDYRARSIRTFNQRNIERNIKLAIDSMLGSQSKSELSIIMDRFDLGRSIQRKMKDAIDFMLGINKPEFTSGSDPASADNCSMTASKTPEPTWYVASAAAHHMTGNLDLLNGYTPMSADLVVHAANMGPMQVHGSGSVNTANVDLPDVWYVPGLDANLISTSQLAKLGYTITLGPYGCRISKDDEDETLIGKAHFTDDYLFELDFLKIPSDN